MSTQKQAPYLLQIGDKVKFFRESKPYTVRATSKRYTICTKPFNLQNTVLYTIIDWEDQIRGPENLIFGMGAETDRECFEMLVRLLDDETEVSWRRHVDLDVEWIKGGYKGQERVYDHVNGEVTLKQILSETKK